MQTLHLQGKKITLPTHYNQLNTRQLKALCILIAQGLQGYNLALAFALAQCQLHPIRLKQTPTQGKHLIVKYRGSFTRYAIPPLALRTLAHTQSWLFHTPTHQGKPLQPILLPEGAPYSTLTSPHAITLPHGYTLPGIALNECTLGQFLTIENIRHHPAPPHPLAWMVPLVSQAAKPPTPQKLQKKLRPWQIAAITLYYQGSLRTLQELFPTLFCTHDETQKSPTQPLSLLYTLAAGDPLRVDPLRHTPLYDALLTLQNTLQKQNA